MKPSTLERLQRVIEDAAQDLLLDHQAEMSRAWLELKSQTSIDQAVGAAYLQGMREERQRTCTLIRRQQRECNRGSLAWNRMQRLLALLGGEDV